MVGPDPDAEDVTAPDDSCGTADRDAAIEQERWDLENAAAAARVPVVLKSPWYTYVVAEGVDVRKPGIYVWTIEGRGSYVGRYKSIARPTREYADTLRKMLQEDRRRKATPGTYRRIHHELKSAYEEMRPITLTIRANANASDSVRIERELVAEYTALSQSLNGAA
ncbi:hypothetical protein BH10ACI4_BH10ACI4_39000 [soil metagenome]